MVRCSRETGETGSHDHARERQAERKFNVVDRRHWADKSDKDERPDKPKKPSYVEDLEGQLKAREDRLQDTLNRHREAVAEFEAARTRLQRDVSQEVERQKRLILLELLEVVDNLDRAVLAGTTATEIATLREGVALVRDQFLAKLKSLGVARRQSLDAAFDPKWHDAVTEMPVDDLARDGVVLGVVQEGYEINGEPLRPAQVAVGKRKG